VDADRPFLATSFPSPSCVSQFGSILYGHESFFSMWQVFPRGSANCSPSAMEFPSPGIIPMVTAGFFLGFVLPKWLLPPLLPGPCSSFVLRKPFLTQVRHHPFFFFFPISPPAYLFPFPYLRLGSSRSTPFHVFRFWARARFNFRAASRPSLSPPRWEASKTHL